MSRFALDRRLLAEMAREEYRLHARLFGGHRFAAFPAFVAVVAAAAVWTLVETGSEPERLVAGVHVLVFLFGLHTGSLGLVGRDALRDVLGEVTLLLSAGRTLPVSQARLLGLFVLKDVGYYAALFLAPLTVAFLAVLPVASLPGLFAALVGTFALGIAITFLLLGVATRGGVVRFAVAYVLVGLVLAWVAGADLARLSPYALYAAPGSGDAVLSLGVLGAVSLAGALTYEPNVERPVRTTRDRFGSLADSLGDPLLAKTVLDVSRSSGGLWKVPLGGGLLFVVTVFLMDVVASVTGVRPSAGLAVGTIMGTAAFTTYGTLAQFDAIESYRGLPVAVADLFRAKRRAFVLLGYPTALGYVALAAALLGAPTLEVLVGAILALGLSTYLFGLTVWLTGFSPNEFLYDTVLFAGFTAGVAVPTVPVLVVAFAVDPVPTALLSALGASAVAFALVGHLLYRRAVPRWTARYRRS